MTLSVGDKLAKVALTVPGQPNEPFIITGEVARIFEVKKIMDISETEKVVLLKEVE